MSAHAQTWYHDDLPAHLDRLREPFEGDAACDVCIIGGGFTGVCAAYHLARGGQRVVLLEANRVGWGASGRNGGQIHPGLRKDLFWFERRFGKDIATRVNQASRAALDHLDGLISELAIPCQRSHGLLTACRTHTDLEEEMAGAESAHLRFGTPLLQALDAAQAHEALGTGGHVGAVRDNEAGHIQPLTFVTALADAAQAAGALIHDQSKVDGLVESAGHVLVRTSRGTLKAGHVVLAGNGYMRGLSAEMDARVLPINNFIIATKPIGAGMPGGILPGGEAACDTRFIVRYWRPTPDGRLLFGGGEKFSNSFPADIQAFVRRHLVEVYPQLSDVGIDHAWGGTLAITANRLPLIRQAGPRVTLAAGFSGQGVLNAPFAGKIIAQALTHYRALLELFSAFPCPPFPGGTALRAPILFLAMSWFALMDRIG